MTPLLQIEGGHVNHKKVERLGREEGLQVPDATNPANDDMIISIPSFACIPCTRIPSAVWIVSRTG